MALQRAGKSTIQHGIDNQTAFNIGNVHADWFDMNHFSTYGRLHHKYVSVLSELTKLAKLYVVFSYNTPIAWFDGEKWTIPTDSYSVTTKNHQNVVSVAIHNPSFYLR